MSVTSIVMVVPSRTTSTALAPARAVTLVLIAARSTRKPRRGLRVSRSGLRGAPDAAHTGRADTGAMRSTYAVVWREGPGRLARGRLELLPGKLELDGLAGSSHVTHEIGYDELSGVHVGRSSAERLDGHPTLVLDRLNAEPFVIASVALQGVVAELAVRLSCCIAA
jgi:hypothetical protein